MPALYKLTVHPNADVRRSAVALIGAVEQLCEPPVQFEKPDRRLETHAAKVFNRRGTDALTKQNAPERALEEFNKALVLDPNDPTLLANKASALGALGRYDESVAALDLALKADVANPKLVLYRAEYLGRSGRLTEARESFSALVAAGFEGAAGRVKWCDELINRRAKKN